MRDRIQGTEDIKSLSPRGGIDKESLKAPEEAEKRLQDNMRCIDIGNVASSPWSCPQPMLFQ